MAGMNAVLSAEIGHLTTMEKLSLIEEVWDSLSTNDNTIPIPEWHKTALAEDQALYDANPSEGSSWNDVKSRITRKP